MNVVHPTYLSLVIATCRIADDCAGSTIVGGFGMFSVAKLSRDDWRFGLTASVVETIDDELPLLTRMADALPMPTFLIGELIEKHLFAPLLEAADRLPSPAGAYVGMRVARLRRALPVDVALGAARRSAPLPFAEPITITPPAAVRILDGKVVDRDAVRARLEARAITNWLRFLRRPGQPIVDIAGIATLTWMAAEGWKT